MARFKIEQYEIHITEYEIEAEDAAEAIQKLNNGDGDITNINSNSYGIPDGYGMSVGKLSKKEAEKLGLSFGEIVPGIRSVREL
jgi:hypothetical protein